MLVLHWAVDQDGNVLLNEIGREVTGYPHRTVADVLRFLHVEDREHARRLFTEALFGRKLCAASFRILCSDGAYRRCSVVGEPVTFRDEFAGYRGTLMVNFSSRSACADTPKLIRGLIEDGTA